MSVITSPSLGGPLLGFQVRTIQEAEGSETLCVVFSGGAKAAEVSEVGTQSSAEKVSSKISKVKMYVEGMEHDSLAWQKKEKRRGVRDDIPYLYNCIRYVLYYTIYIYI